MCVHRQILDSCWTRNENQELSHWFNWRSLAEIQNYKNQILKSRWVTKRSLCLPMLCLPVWPTFFVGKSRRGRALGIDACERNAPPWLRETRWCVLMICRWGAPPHAIFSLPRQRPAKRFSRGATDVVATQRITLSAIRLVSAGSIDRIQRKWKK